MERKKQRRKAFTLVELLVVIVIISMLAAFAAPRLFKVVAKSKRDLAPARLAVVGGAIERFAIDCGRYPDDSEGLQVLLEMPEEMEGKWNGPYCKRSDLIDPWETPIVYIAEGVVNVGSYDLVSLGADGQEGGEGPNEDIVNE